MSEYIRYTDPFLHPNAIVLIVDISISINNLVSASILKVNDLWG